MVLRLIVGDDLILVGEAISARRGTCWRRDRSLMLELFIETDYRNDDGDWSRPRCSTLPEPRRSSRSDVSSSLPAGSPEGRLRPDYRFACEPLETTDLVLVWERGVEPKVEACQHCPKRSRRRPDLAGAGVSRPGTKRQGGGDWLRDQLEASLPNSIEAQKRRSRTSSARTAAECGLIRNAGRCARLGGAARPTLSRLWWRSGSTALALDDAIDKATLRRRRPAAALILPLTPRIQWRSPPAAAGQALQQHAARRCRCRDDKPAAALLEMKGSTFPAKKAMQQSRRLGTEKLDERSTSWPMPIRRRAAPRIGHRSWYRGARRSVGQPQRSAGHGCCIRAGNAQPCAPALRRLASWLW